MQAPLKHILPVIVISQFFCTSLWFAGNGVMGDLILHFDLGQNALGHLTTAVQFGFISGTLVFALLTVPDRFKPSRVFFFSGLTGALFNLLTIADDNTFFSLFVLRFLTGFFLAGIYPVGMKIAADHFDKRLGRSLGYLVGALVLGTALPHLIKACSGQLPWKTTIIITSALAVTGGLLMLTLVPPGPYRRPAPRVDLLAFSRVFRNQSVRSAAFGYFGHMWELYAFWAFVPVLLRTFAETHPGADLHVPALSFVIIAIGSIGCVVGGNASLRFGSKRIASLALAISGFCCVLSPLFFQMESDALFLAALVLWGLAVIPDSPLFSTLIAQSAEPAVRGTALTIVNSIGFAVTIGSIQLLTRLSATIDPAYLFIVLGVGPALGLFFLNRRSSVLEHKTYH